MNYLAHAVLSFDDPDILAGNMISDFVKGKTKFTYPLEIRKGIELHRMIDEFTDLHPATAEAKLFFRPVYRLYSGAFVDIVYDHFLANDRSVFKSADVLLKFTESTYHSLEKNKDNWPVMFATLFHYMKSDNWLYSYRLLMGMNKSFHGLVRRARYMNDAEPAFKIFSENYTALQLCYENFFPELKAFSLKSLRNLRAS